MSQKEFKTLDDIVFENRNKEYGAYDLRTSERSTLTKAFMFGVLVVVLIVGGIVSYNTVFARKDKVETVVDIDLTNIDEPIIDEPEPEEPEPEPEPPKPEPEVAQIKAVMPEPAKEAKVEETIPEQKEMENKAISTVTKDGEESKTIKVETKPEPVKPAGNGNATRTFNAREVSDMAVFPGCEKLKGDKKKLEKCLSDKISNELSSYLTDVTDELSRRGETRAVARLQFVIDKSGKITQVKALPGGNADLGRESKSAIERIATKFVSSGKKIQPAKLDDGTEVSMNFVIPVTFQAE